MSNKLVKKNNMENVTFSALGLDINTNFLEAPLCDCGCGQKQGFYTEDIKQTSGDILMEQDFPVGGILVFRMNGDVLFTLKMGTEDDDILLCLLDLSKHSLQECGQVLQESLQTMEKELGMEAGYLDLKHCGILVEIAENTYKVIEE